MIDHCDTVRGHGNSSWLQLPSTHKPGGFSQEEIANGNQYLAPILHYKIESAERNIKSQRSLIVAIELGYLCHANIWWSVCYLDSEISTVGSRSQAGYNMVKIQASNPGMS